MFCSKCGTQIENGAKFCPSCGAPVGDAQEQPGQQQINSVKDMLKGAKVTVGAPEITLLGRQIPLKTGLIILGVIVVLAIIANALA